MMKIWLGLLALVLVTGCFYSGPCIQGNGPVEIAERELDDFTAVSNTASFEVMVTHSDTFGVRVEAQENLHQFIETYVSGSTLIVKTSNGSCIKPAAPVTVYVDLPYLEEISNTGSGRLYADLAECEDFEMSNTGSGQIQIDAVMASRALVNNSGSGKVFLDESWLESIQLTNTGSGELQAGIIYGPAEMYINHTGSGRIEAELLEGTELEVGLTGSGRIILVGDAEKASYKLSSSGRIDALEMMVENVRVSSSGSGKVYVFAVDYLDVTITGSGDVLYTGNPTISSKITGSGDLRKY